MGRGMRFPAMWHFDMCRLRQASAASFWSLETPNGIQSVAQPTYNTSNDKQRLWSDCAYAQADLSLLLVAHTTLLEILCTGSIIFEIPYRWIHVQATRPVLHPCARHFIHCLVLIQLKKTCPNMTENCSQSNNKRKLDQMIQKLIHYHQPIQP